MLSIRSNSTRGGRLLSRNRKPSLERLEDRLVLFAANGGAWLYNTITYSFVPDGTLVAQSFPNNITSNLNQSFNAEGISTQVWQQQFEKAASVWEAVANINLVQVGDDGLPFGSSNYQQGNPTEGDIRIGGYSQAPGVLSQTFMPPPINGGSIAGDILFNTSQPWQVNANYDVETVAIHEIGHALGLADSQIQQAVMYAYYGGLRQQLAPDDVQGIDSIYGPRQADAFNSNGNHNATYTTAANISSSFTSLDQITLTNLSLNTASQSEWFKVVIPAGGNGSLSAAMQMPALAR